MLFIRRVAAATFLLALPAVAHAACTDYDSQAEAQRALTLGKYDLDEKGNGIACESHFSVNEKTSRYAHLTCEGFSSRKEAQRLYQIGARHLDADRNGRACDSPGNKVTKPPTMASTCADFTTQEQAQDAFISGIPNLDPDNNGLACEHLPSQLQINAGDDIDNLGKPSFKWQQNDLGVQPRASRSFTTWPSH